MKKNSLLIVSFFCATALSAQTPHSTAFLTDSSDTKPLNEVIVKAYEQNRKLTDVGAPVSIVSKASLNRFSNTNILQALNTNPGVRMEERSPGSYRLNVWLEQQAGPRRPVNHQITVPAAEGEQADAAIDVGEISLDGA